MKLSKLAMLAAIACGLCATGVQQADANDTIQLVSHCASSCDCGEPICGCESTGCCESDPCCDSDCCDSGCDSMGCGLGDCLGGDCCLGDPWSLFGDLGKYSVGGWIQMGYHTKANSIFNTRPDEYQLHQAWLYAQRNIDTSCGFDIGGRIDYVYGTDGPNTQAFGTDPRGWDNDWDNGNDYGHAIPQAFFEAGYGDMSVMVGHFFTIIGYEVVAAPDNFFYSHSYTMNFSEPFTHSGALMKYNATDDLTVYGGYSLGWDSGFDDNGDAFLGGFSAQLNDSVTFNYMTSFGRLQDLRYGGVAGSVRGQMHSIVSITQLNDKLSHIGWIDYLDTETSGGMDGRDSLAFVNALLYNINDCWGIGGRFESYDLKNGGLVTGGNDNGTVNQLTIGINHRPHANVIIRPEVRQDWDDNLVAGLEDGDEQTTFGIDTIFLF